MPSAAEKPAALDLNAERAPPEWAGLTFLPVPEFSDAEMTFGAPRSAYFNRYDLPKVPRKYEDFIDRLFFSGGKMPKLAADVDREKASRTLRALLTSFAPAHEAKTTTAAYALWAWGAVIPAEG